MIKPSPSTQRMAQIMGVRWGFSPCWEKPDAGLQGQAPAGASAPQPKERMRPLAIEASK